jgi:hypothetical protein
MRALRRVASLGGLTLLILQLSQTGFADGDAPAVDREQRHIEGGSLIFIGHGADAVPEIARFKAQTMAVQGVATECMLALREIKFDEYLHQRKDTRHIYTVKASIDLEACEAGKRATSPAEVRRLTNPTLAEDLKKYRDMVLGGGLPGGAPKTQTVVQPVYVPYVVDDPSVPVQPQRAIASITPRNCDLEGRRSCHAMGMIAESVGDLSVSQRFFKRGCLLGDERSCRKSLRDP